MITGWGHIFVVFEWGSDLFMFGSSSNPKLLGSGIVDGRVQVGLCPNDCAECFYNRPGAYYCDIDQPQIPDPEEVNTKGLIVRMNSGHDSHFQKEEVIECARHYDDVFFNTAMLDFDYPGPVVFTANRLEEEPAWCPIVHRQNKTRQIHPNQEQYFDRLMFVRLRVSPTNLELVKHAVAAWTAKDIPVVLTFMAYYSQTPSGTNIREGEMEGQALEQRSYEWKVRTLNSYRCPTSSFMQHVLYEMQKYGGRLVTMCGTLDSGKCRDCKNCQAQYWVTKKRLVERKLP